MSKDEGIKRALESAAHEETEHLAWTERRIAEAGRAQRACSIRCGTGSLAIGMLAARFGDGVNLGFLAETERQVESPEEPSGPAAAAGPALAEIVDR